MAISAIMQFVTHERRENFIDHLAIATHLMKKGMDAIPPGLRKHPVPANIYVRLRPWTNRAKSKLEACTWNH